MNKTIIFLVLALLVIPYSFALESSSGGEGSGEGWFEKQNRVLKENLCVNYPSYCSAEIIETGSYGADAELIERYSFGAEANLPLSEQEILKKRIDSARERTTVMFSLLSSFWTLTLILLNALFIFIEVYLVLWGLFILIPKLLTLIIKKMASSGVFGKWAGK